MASGGVPRRRASPDSPSRASASSSWAGGIGATAAISSWLNSRPIAAPIWATSFTGMKRSSRAIKIDEIVAQIERPGWEERLHYAEVLRLKGWMLSLKGDLEGAERNFLAS